MALTAEVLERCGVPAATARANLPYMIAAMRGFAITTPARARMFLAQVLHESIKLTHFEELESGAKYEGNRALGNTQPGDGMRFKGRGPIQLTGRWNYQHYGALLGPDLDGPRRRFDAAAETALRAFQADHGLAVDGRYGPRSARALARVTARQKA